ncbi:MAG: hypothetical protein COA45_02120 [Zetaproteobacteria bacterium]|nr:MAG: hypothetical protein COA45_02120 [Zetaproteobacteria bacterium]
MTKRVASNSAKLDLIENVMSQFHTHCGISQQTPVTPEASLNYGNVNPDDVIEFSNTLRQALEEHVTGTGEPAATFRHAQSLRMGLLSSPEVKNQNGGQVDIYLKNVMVIEDNVLDSLKATATLHADSLNPNYQGEDPADKNADTAPTREPIL